MNGGTSADETEDLRFKKKGLERDSAIFGAIEFIRGLIQSAKAQHPM